MAREGIESAEHFQELCEEYEKQGSGFWVEMFPKKEYWENELKPKLEEQGKIKDRSNLYLHFYVDATIHKSFVGGIVNFFEYTPKHKDFNISSLANSSFEKYHFNLLGESSSFRKNPKDIDYTIALREKFGFLGWYCFIVGIWAVAHSCFCFFKYFTNESFDISFFNFLNIPLGLLNLYIAYKEFTYKESKR